MPNETYLKFILSHIAEGHSVLCPSCAWIGHVDDLRRCYDEKGMQLVCPDCGGEVIHGVEGIAEYVLDKVEDKVLS